MTAQRRKRRMRKRNRNRRRRNNRFLIIKGIMKRLAVALSGAMAVIVGIAAGHEYYWTGSVDQTLEAVCEIPGAALELLGVAQERGQDLLESMPELPDGVQKTLAKAADGMQGLTGWMPDFVTELPKQAGQLGDQAVRWLFGIAGSDAGSTTLETIPEYQGDSYVELYGNVPSFTDEEREGPAYEYYSELDWLGRCGYAEAKITQALMPTEERGQIGAVRPSGWHTVKYAGIDGNYLYNRCHLIGYQLTGENANEKNLITGTRYMNVTGMLPWENLVADYIQDTGDAVLYRVTPVYDGDNLVASGVEMEAESLESEEIRFHIFVFNVQPGIIIDYANGESRKE